MVVKKGERYGGPWYSRYRDLVVFERGVKEQFSQLSAKNKRSGHDIWREYNLIIDVPEYEPRKVLIKMKAEVGGTPKVTVDGLEDSPHRYHDEGGELCMWYPWDPKECRWIFSDGLLHLLVLIQMHLFREAWWRETGGVDGGEWLGPEVLHVDDEI